MVRNDVISEGRRGILTLTTRSIHTVQDARQTRLQFTPISLEMAVIKVTSVCPVAILMTLRDTLICKENSDFNYINNSEIDKRRKNSKLSLTKFQN